MDSVRKTTFFCFIHYWIIDEFSQHINFIYPNIQFTVEIEKDRSLPFLDVQITRNANNTLRTTIHQKPTHTNRYLQPPQACYCQESI